MMRMDSSLLCLYDSRWLSSLLNPLMYRFHLRNFGTDIDHPDEHKIVYLVTVT